MSSREEELFVGVDGGGTSTRLALLAADGELRALAQAGCGNPLDVGERGLASALDQAWRDAWSTLGVAPRPCAAACLGLAGAADERERERAHALAVELGLAPYEQVEVSHDLSIALHGALLGEAGLVLVAGTGSACYGRSESGSSARAGGWGPFLDDLGGGYDLGRSALIACVQAQDGRGPGTELESAVRAELGLTSWRQLVSRVGPGGLSRAEIAALAPLVLSASRAGDVVAGELLSEGAAELARAAGAVARQLAWSEPPVALAGGLLATPGPYRALVEEALGRLLPGARPCQARLSPVLGAALRASTRAGNGLSSESLRRLLDS